MKENSLIIRSNEEIKKRIEKLDSKIFLVGILSYLSLTIMFIGFMGFAITQDMVYMLFTLMGGISYIENLIALSSFSMHQEIWINRLENRKLKDVIDLTLASLDFLDLKYDNDRIFTKIEKDKLKLKNEKRNSKR
jgi:hypothetical protein